MTVLAVVLGPPTRRRVVHELAAMWIGPACNLGADPATHLVPGVTVEAERVTCWACRNPDEARSLHADWLKRRAKILRGAR